MVFWIVLGVLFVGWIFVNLPRRRCDGDLITTLHPYRRMLAFVMPRSNDSTVYFDDYVKADKLLDYIKRCRKKFHIDLTHCVVQACNIGLRENPRMNQFVAGQRLYRRNHKAITFSIKRQKMNKEAKVSAVKMKIPDDQSFETLCGRINEKIGIERSDEETYVDKELGIFFMLPRFAVRWAMNIVRWADYHNLLPKSFIESDAFFTSIFIANLGSVGMRAGYHHLYEYGTCPLFIMVGMIEDRPMVVDGEVVVQKILHIRFTYDERIDDGLTSRYGIESVRNALENPEEYFGEVEDFERGAGAEEAAPAPAPAPDPDPDPDPAPDPEAKDPS